MAITRSQQAKQMLQEGGGAKPPKLGNPPVIEEIENMREFRIANPDVKNIFDLEREINRKNKLSPKGLEILLRLLNMENKSSNEEEMQ